MNKVALRSLKKTDSRAISKLVNNKNIWDNLRDFIPYPYTIKDAEEYIEFALAENNSIIFGITYGGELCGVVGLDRQTDVYRYSAELGYWLGESYWGKGIMTEAVKQITKFGFEKLNLNRIYAGIFSTNVASIKVLEKNRFICEGINKLAVVKNGVLQDEHRYALLSALK